MRLAYFGAIALASVAVGCGGDDDNGSGGGDEDAVAAVVADFAKAGHDGDGEKICVDIFAPELTENVRRAAKQSCPAEVQENLPEGEYELTVDSLEVDGDNATVSVTDQKDNSSVMHLVKTDDEWRILRITDG